MLIGAVIQVKRHRHIDVQILQHSVYHSYHHVISAHVLAGPLGHTENYGGFALLCSQQNGLGPLQIIDVKLTHRIVACFCFFEHFSCRY